MAAEVEMNSLRVSTLLKSHMLAQHLRSHVKTMSRRYVLNTEASCHPRRIFSGIQPTGVLHIGNYLGAIKNWVALQHESETEVLYSVVDLHSITVPWASRELSQSIRGMVIGLLACGLDPEKSIIFQQSKVPGHAELAWILGCLTPTGHLNRMHQWKSKWSQHREQVCLGVYSYPVLMSSDILLYKASHVPIGDDQLQHLELTRELARLFNNKYGEFFPSPQPILGNFTRVMSLRDPTSKMSKSDTNSLSRIEITDTSDEIRNKVRKAVTDSEPEINYDPQARPGMTNLVNIYSAFSGLTRENICLKYQNLEHCKSVFKDDLAEVLVSELEPIRSEILRLQQDPGYIDGVLEEGAERAWMIASKNITAVKQLVGLL